ncbi:MAG TPA: hypothetical protein VFY46_04670, partial [Acidimicrobiia bacterium]|nr:hypothetical protein [Acidimicrobiia bacterium]
MFDSTISTDQIEQRMIHRQAEISRLTAEQLADLEELDYRQVATGDGCRSLSEWVASRLDVSLGTARSLVRTMRRTQDRPDLREALETGVSFDRIEAVSRIPDRIGLLEHLDVAGVEREAALHTRITAGDEQRNWDDQFLILQPSLVSHGGNCGEGWTGRPGPIVDQTLTETADQLPADPETRRDRGWRRAMGLAQICISDTPPPAQVTVHVDAKHAAQSNGQAGVVLEAGPRVGRQALEAVLCDAVVEITARREDGIPMVYGQKTMGRPFPRHYAGPSSTATDTCVS